MSIISDWSTDFKCKEFTNYYQLEKSRVQRRKWVFSLIIETNMVDRFKCRKNKKSSVGEYVSFLNVWELLRREFRNLSSWETPNAKRRAQTGKRPYETLCSALNLRWNVPFPAQRLFLLLLESPGKDCPKLSIRRVTIVYRNVSFMRCNITRFCRACWRKPPSRRLYSCSSPREVIGCSRAILISPSWIGESRLPKYWMFTWCLAWCPGKWPTLPLPFGLQSIFFVHFIAV